MKVLIHACPERMWYVEEFLKPELLRQGADEIEIWNDTEKRGNLFACIDSFATRSGKGGTWHIQDDVLLCHDFVTRCRELDIGVAYGFCCRNFGDRLDKEGTSGARPFKLYLKHKTCHCEKRSDVALKD